MVPNTMEENRTAYHSGDLQLELERDLWQESVTQGDTSELAAWIGFESPPLVYYDQTCNSQNNEDLGTLLFSTGHDNGSSTRSSQSESSDSTSALLDDLRSEEASLTLASTQAVLRNSLGPLRDPARDLKRETRQKEQKEKRRQQNRMAQQRFREGREAKMKEAQEKIILLETRLKFQIERNRMLEREWLRMKTEVDRMHLNDTVYSMSHTGEEMMRADW